MNRDSLRFVFRVLVAPAVDSSDREASALLMSRFLTHRISNLLCSRPAHVSPRYRHEIQFSQ